VLIQGKGDGGWVVTHVRDAAVVARGEFAGEVWRRAEDARLIARNTAEGKFRAIHSAPTLRGGWRLDLSDVAEVRRALDFFYPAALGVWLGMESGVVRGTPLRQYLGRQTGMYRFSNGVSDEQIPAMAVKECGGGKCLRRIVWPLEDGVPLSEVAAEKTGQEVGFASERVGATCVPLVCIEPCPVIVGAARKLARANFEAKAASEAT
jgi:sirohydrochlorin cobaltochelatase